MKSIHQISVLLGIGGRERFPIYIHAIITAGRHEICQTVDEG